MSSGQLLPLMSQDSWDLVHQATYDEDEDLTAAIVFAIAELEAVDPIEVRPNLYDSVDISAVESLFDIPEEDNSVVKSSLEFDYSDYHIVVSSDGRIQIYEPSTR